MSLLERLNRKKNKGIAAKSEFVQQPKKTFAKQAEDVREDAYQAVKTQIHDDIVFQMPDELQAAISKPDTNQQDVRAIVEKLCNQALQNNPFAIPLGDRERIVDELVSEILGLGPLEPLLKDSTITEVMVNGPKNIYVERNGHIVKTRVTFRDDAHLMHVIDRIVTAIGRRVDESSPMCDARLADGSRVNVIIPPLSLVGPVITIRKFSNDAITIEKLISFGSLDKRVATFLRACVEGRLNIVISGGTGSGKTTLLNVMSSFIPHEERIVTLEDSAELQLKQEHVVTLETRPPNIEGEGEVSMRDLVRNALRMRPDRIVVGECRSGEALDMLQAMNTGHDGSMTTAHANSPRDMLTRLETMVLMSGMELPLKAIRAQVASAVDLIVQIARLRDGSRKVISVSEVTGIEGETVTTQELFYFTQEGFDENNRIYGHYDCAGVMPYCMDKLTMNGVSLPEDMFTN